MDLRRFVKPLRFLNDPSLKPLNREFLSPLHQKIYERDQAAKRKRELEAEETEKAVQQEKENVENSVAEILEEEPPKKKLRGNYREYSDEVRNSVARYAKVYGVKSAVKRFANYENGLGIPEKTST
jgi:hypothetical protein